MDKHIFTLRDYFYLSLCKLCKLGHGKFHLALLRTRGLRCGLWLYLLRWSSRTCYSLLSRTSRSCAGTRNCCWDRLTSDYLSHYLLWLTCKRIICDKKKEKLANILVINTINLWIRTPCRNVLSNKRSKYCNLHRTFHYKPFCYVVDWRRSVKCFYFHPVHISTRNFKHFFFNIQKGSRNKKLLWTFFLKKKKGNFNY